MVAPINDLRESMNNEEARWPGRLEVAIDNAISRAAQEGYSGIKSHCFVTRLPRREVLKVLERYEEAGYKTKVSWFKREVNIGKTGYKISVHW